ncbi:hypothetical protein ACTTAI_16185 [Rhodobacter capsulatus]|uniref:hypothetical protein n=1 Tax=Rhodobacter capsulatus TaxID=1061 RepID=UPI0040276E2C
MIWDAANITAPHTLREIEQAETTKRQPRGACCTCGTYDGRPHLIPCEAGPGIVRPEDF